MRHDLSLAAKRIEEAAGLMMPENRAGAPIAFYHLLQRLRPTPKAQPDWEERTEKSSLDDKTRILHAAESQSSWLIPARFRIF